MGGRTCLWHGKFLTPTFAFGGLAPTQQQEFFGKRAARELCEDMSKNVQDRENIVNFELTVQEGTEQMKSLLDEHVGALLDYRDKHNVKDVDLLTGQKWWKRLADRKVQGSIQSLHERMRKVIRGVALAVEQGGYQSAQEAIVRMGASKQERDRALRLVEADHALQVSFTALKVTIEIFARLNEWIVSRVEGGKDIPGDEEQRLLLANAILVYELTDFCLGSIEHFELEGLPQIHELREATMRDLAAVRQADWNLRRRAGAKDLDPEFSKRVLADIANREQAIQIVEREWEAYLRELQSAQDQAVSIRKKQKALRLVRDNARSQIAVLSAVSVLRLVRSNLSSLESAIRELENTRLAALSPERVRRLLRVDAPAERNLPVAG